MTSSFLDTAKIAVVGLGYVGLPLAVTFGRQFPVVGFDINKARIAELSAGADKTLEVDPQALAASKHLIFSDDAAAIAGCNIFIITAPTPIDRYNRPDLTPLLSASKTVGMAIKPGDLVIYESTVYPGATEEDCVPVLEEMSGLKFNTDFFVGYSPERINPGDKAHRLETVIKITAGSTPETAERVDALYSSIVKAGTFRAASIRVAEAAKVIENTQRDLNIALMNELAIVFNKMGIDTQAVLEAAGTKWNFLPFRPGLVGGHCIGVDPYYLTHKAQEVGHHPEIILAGRRLNDGMGQYISTQAIKGMVKRHIQPAGARVLIMGLAFKENCPDLRNTRVVDIINELKQYQCHVDVYDPWVSATEARAEYGIELTTEPAAGTYDAVILAVAHREFAEMGAEAIHALCRSEHLVYDLKYVLPADASDLRL